MGRLVAPSHPDLLVGTDTGDDAAVWRLDATRGLVATTDFFTPVVDDPRLWGRIAAQNAASDVYAMGGSPWFALNIVAWPSGQLPTDVLAEVLAGGAETAQTGGFVIVGGHTIDDPEPKYGLAVVGEVLLEHLLTNAGLRDGDVLVLTKALGVGIATTAIKRGVDHPRLINAAIESMTASNAAAARVATEAGATGCTDVTGFGLLGHLARMARASAVDVVLDVDAVPVLPGARDLAAAGVVPGGTQRNRDWVTQAVAPGPRTEADLLILADPQTSGGLLFGVRPARAEAVVAALGAPAAVIGRARQGTGRIELR
jgi:selenide,water dikinase